MIDRETLTKSCDEIKVIVDKYSETPLDMILIMKHSTWMIENTILVSMLKDKFSLEMKKK